MAKDVLHVVPHEQAWAVRREGNERVTTTRPTQKDAIEAARELAKEQDDIVIHRPDGTIRERVTYIGSTATSQANGEVRTVADTHETHPEDLASVGSRVSWGAVLAGAAVALAASFALSLLALAIGLTVSDNVTSRTNGTLAAVLSAAILFASLFYGGYVASRVTAGERPAEGVMYGVLVWGTMFLLLALGVRLGTPVATGAFGPVNAPAVSADRVKQELGLNDRQAEKYAALTGAAATTEVNPRAAAWWTFFGVVLSLLSAAAGGWLGTGAQVVFQVVRRADDLRPAVEPRPA